MKRLILVLITVSIFLFSVSAQRKNFTYKFYGFVRGDLFYNTRANMAPVDGNFYLYPLDVKPDADGKDLNAVPNGSFYTFTTRLGIDVTGPDIGKARTSAKVETDFGGFSGNTTVLRVRQAYVALDWGKSNVTIGQTWHPLFGAVFPDILNLSTGAPFQPFNRSPQLRYQYRTNGWNLTASALWQLQYLSSGPNGMSEDYIKNSCVPEFYIGADYSANNWLLGAGGHLISLKPRTSAEWQGKTYKVNERMTALSYEAHLKYTGKNYTFAAKSLMASCLDHTALIGGYGISAINPANGEQEYTPFRHSTTWVNFTYGQKWKPALFLGYTKNMGTNKSLVTPTTVYGMGLDIDQLLSANINLSYNLPHWQIGLEYSASVAWYGTIDSGSGKVKDTHSVTNHRILGLVMYYF
ncbi:DcaP family trimeric outer membrane transporter [Parabacteroides bouchesdurhonensis]|uniref:DcaP family trimeric outer membrane transporter n=1 Tax=Parabacteroides bouchesdurhonensis TaxID=1936995 RepID=UPI000C84DB21|nr:DcaP family trimeric outer membrane transporter [Parabacteroides bouchesdurhonensis]